MSVSISLAKGGTPALAPNRLTGCFLSPPSMCSDTTFTLWLGYRIKRLYLNGSSTWAFLRSHPRAFTTFSELFLLAGLWEPLTGHADMFQVKSAYKTPVIHAIKDTLSVNIILFKYFIHVYTFGMRRICHTLLGSPWTCLSGLANSDGTQMIVTSLAGM